MKSINKRTVLIVFLAVLVGMVFGRLFFGGNNVEVADNKDSKMVRNQVWTCSMHPQIRQTEPGKCPICGMDLIPLNNEDEGENTTTIKMSPTAMQLANVQTALVKKIKPLKTIRLNGKVQPDERKVFSQTAHFSGRIEQLFINYTGEPIKKGQEIAYVYSPELVTAQEELLEAYKIKDTQIALYNAAREKLKNWKLTDNQINAIISSQTLMERFPIRSDLSGVVLTKKVSAGDYVSKGTALFEVGDLSRVWILLDVYEAEMAWVKKGNEVTYAVSSFPGETFKGKVNFVDPVINPKTRVAKARLVVDNKHLKLKPEMFVTATLKAPVKEQGPSIVVPKSAVMWTGEKSVVYVKSSSASGISFEWRQVTLGTSLGDDFLVKEGLEEGEEIAVHGTFSIDAAAQLAGKPSMINPGPNVPSSQLSIKEKGKLNNIQVNDKAKEALGNLVNDYLVLKDALVQDNLSQAKKQAGLFLHNLKKVDIQWFEGGAHRVWMLNGKKSEKDLNQMGKASNIEEVRVLFGDLSTQFIALAQQLGPFKDTLYLQHCPMADNNKGGDWISKDKQVKNPYFGASMLACGEVTEVVK